MTHLNPIMRELIATYSAGAVATVNEDGTPAVSPKATFVVIDDYTIAFGDIRSPATVANLRSRPAVEVVFTDVLRRRAVRIKGHAIVIDKACEDGQQLVRAFEESWALYIDHIERFVRIEIRAAELILSPAYDIGLTADELRRINLEKLAET